MDFYEIGALLSLVCFDFEISNITFLTFVFMLEIFSLETEVLEPSDIHPHLALLVEDFIKDLNSNTNNILPISIFSILFKMFH